MRLISSVSAAGNVRVRGNLTGVQNMPDRRWALHTFGQEVYRAGPVPAAIDIMMRFYQHQDVRTTLTLDEDVAAKLRSLARRTGRAFKDVVNEAIRRGLATTSPPSRKEPFKVRAHDLGPLRRGLDLDNIGEVLERTRGRCTDDSG